MFGPIYALKIHFAYCYCAESADRKIELVDAMNIVSKVTRYMNLGTQLYVPSWKLNEISQYPPEEQKSRIIQGWFEHDNNPTYGTLYRALKQPSVDDKRAALQVSKLCRTISVDSSVSADGIYHKTTSVDASGGIYILRAFDESLNYAQNFHFKSVMLIIILFVKHIITYHYTIGAIWDIYVPWKF